MARSLIRAFLENSKHFSSFFVYNLYQSGLNSVGSPGGYKREEAVEYDDDDDDDDDDFGLFQVHHLDNYKDRSPAYKCIANQ